MSTKATEPPTLGSRHTSPTSIRVWSRTDRLRCERVVVVQVTKVGPRDQVGAPAAKRRGFPPDTRLLGCWDAHQPLVRPKPIVVEVEHRQRTPKMVIRQEDEVFQALSTESPDEAFDVSLGVRCTVRDWNPLDAEYAMEPGIERTAVLTWELDTSPWVLPEDAVVVVKQKPWRLAPWSGLPKLLFDPAQRRRPGHGEVNDLTGVQSHDDQDVASREVPHHLCGEVHREELVGVGGQETAPCRLRWPADSTMYCLIVLVLWSTPSLIFISSAIRPSPHSGWSVEMRLMKAMCWRGILGRPGELPERRLQ